MADLPARTADDILYKLMPLALHEHGPDMYDGTFALRWRPQQLGPMLLEDQMWRGLIDSMLALSPRIREVVAMPHPRPPAGHPDMVLPEGLPPIEQVTRWLNCLETDSSRYAKLWLRLMDAAGATDRLWCSSADCSPGCLAFEQSLKGHLAAAGHRQAVVDRLRSTCAPSAVEQPSTLALLAERQRAFVSAEETAGDTEVHGRWLAELVRLEGDVLASRAATKDDLLAKALLAVRILAEERPSLRSKRMPCSVRRRSWACR